MYELNNLLTELIFIVLHAVLFLVNYTLFKKNLFHPSVLFSLCWAVIVLLHFIFGLTILDQLFPVSFETYLILFIGTVSFSIGALMVSFLQKPGIVTDITPTAINRPGLLLRILFIAIIVIGLPFYIQASYRVFLASQIDNFFVGLRTELSYGEEDIGITKYLVSFSFLVFSINYYAFLNEKNRLNRILVIVSILLSIVYAVFATGRTFFFMILAIYLGLSYLHKKSFAIRKYLWVFLLFIPVFLFIGMIYGKGGDTEASFKENLDSSAETTAIYLVSSLSALDLETKRHVQANYGGENTLLFFVKIGKQLNIIPDKQEGTLLSDFVYIPYGTNVFTFYSPYIRDYGRIYAWIMIALFGALHSWIFYRARKTGNLRYSLYYAFLLYPLLMSFFQDQYMSLFSTWLQLVFYTEAFILTDQLIRSRKWRNSSDV